MTGVVKASDSFYIYFDPENERVEKINKEDVQKFLCDDLCSIWIDVSKFNQLLTFAYKFIETSKENINTSPSPDSKNDMSKGG